MFHRLDMYFKTPLENKQLYSSLGVKLHGYLFSHIPQDLADKFHHAELVPFSAFVCKGGEGTSIYRVCILHEDAECFLEPLKRVDEVPIYGLKSPLKIIKTMDVARQPVETLAGIQDISEFDFILASPATYKKYGKYSNWFDLRGLMRSVAQKLAKFENIEIDNRTVDFIVSKIELQSYRFESASYILAKSPIPCFVGGAHIKLCGEKELIRTANLLFRYAEYAGVGAKTAMGMGGVVINFESRAKL